MRKIKVFEGFKQLTFVNGIAKLKPLYECNHCKLQTLNPKKHECLSQKLINEANNLQ